METEEEPPFQPRRSQNLKVSLAENSDAPACAHSSFPNARGGIDWRAPVCQASLAPNRGCGSGEEKESGGGQEEGAAARGYPPPPSSTTINTFAHQHTHRLLKGSLGVAVVAGLIFCRASGIVSFQTKARSLAREAQQLKRRRTRTSLEEWHLNEGGGLATCLGAREVDWREIENFRPPDNRK